MNSFLRTLIKRIVMLLYNRGLISSRTVEKMFYRFDLKGQ